MIRSLKQQKIQTYPPAINNDPKRGPLSSIKTNTVV
jgi:hypothetical protein